MQKYKLVVTAPLTHADIVREAIGIASGGKIGKYSHCSFSTRGQGRFIPLNGANPHIGSIGTSEVVEEEQIEVTVNQEVLEDVIQAMKRVHPYEEVVYDVYKLENL